MFQKFIKYLIINIAKIKMNSDLATHLLMFKSEENIRVE